MNTLLLALLLQVPQDTVVVRVPIPQPEATRDTTIIDLTVDMQPFGDSLLAVISRVQADVNASISACSECQASAGPPDWFYAGVLTLGSLFLYRYWRTSSPDDDDPMSDDPEEPYRYEVPWTPDAPDPCDPPRKRKKRKGG